MSKKAWIKLIGILIVVILFVILVWLNAGERARLHFILWRGDFPLILLMIIIFALGLIAGIFTAFKVSAGKEKKR